MSRRRRATWRSTLFVALLLVVLFVFRGFVPLPGDRSGEAPDRAAGAGSGMPEGSGEPEPRVEQDLVAARRARLAWLVARERFEESVRLARAMAERGASPRERAAGRRHVAVDGPIFTSLVARLEDDLERGRFAAAEEDWRRIQELFPEHSAETRTAISRPLEVAPIAEHLAPRLPLRLVDAQIWKVGETDCVLRVPGEAGGFRYETKPWTELDPAEVRAVVQRALARSESLQGVLDGLAALYREAGKPIMAWVVRTGRLTLPPATRGRGPATAERR